MKKVQLMMVMLFTLVTMFSCSDSDNSNTTEQEEKVLNSGEISVKNGKDEVDTISFTCVGCSENLTMSQFNKIVNESMDLTKNTLKYPLSFIPKQLEITIIKEDSLYMYDNGKKLENTLTVISQSKYIAKNGYGNELEGDGLVSFNLVNGEVKDISNDIKLEDLKFDEKYINRRLTGTHKYDFIRVTPTKSKSLIVESSLSCVDEGAKFTITLNDKEETEIELGGSYNDFNCDGLTYFNWFKSSQIEKLKSINIKYLYIYSRGESVMVQVPKNQSDYFKQLFNIY